jgi:hypothetical protein
MDFAVLLPPGWVRIPLDGRENARAAALATAKAAEVAAPQRQAVQHKLHQMICQALSHARAAGGTDILLSLTERNGIPLAASCLISYAESTDPIPLGALAQQLRDDGQDISETPIAGRTAIRHRYQEDLITRLDYHLKVPGRSGLMTLAFATPLEPLADAMSTLFDAIAESMRWHR